ncbi:MAG: hypothetical protein AAFU71_02030 [Cyanobacteria bacterium J06632_22]
MQSSPRPLASNTHYCCSGDVLIAETAVVGAGTVLQALPGSQIRVEAGACLGAGVVIQAKAGALVIEAQASLGTGVLLVGYGYIGRAATVGPASTLLNPKVSAHAIIAPNTLYDGQAGQDSQAGKASQYGQGGGQGRGVSTAASTMASTSTFNPYQPTGPQTVPLTPRSTAPVEPRPVEPRPVETADHNGSSNNGSSPYQNGATHGATVNGSGLTTRNTVYGRDQVNGLLSALFPHRQSLNGTGSNPGESHQDEDSVW